MTPQLTRVNESPPVAAFQRHWPNVTPTATITIPGRVNLIGEHVDYCDGIVLPIAIEPSLRITYGPQPAPRLSVYTQTYNESFERDLSDLEQPAEGWTAFTVGIARALHRENIELAGTALYISGDLPIGAGLASSAALCAGVGMALLNTAGISLPPAELAQFCREAERLGVGVPCGIMDPLVCLSARHGFALHIDCRTDESRHIPWPDDDLVALIVDSRLRRELSQSEYAVRVHECRHAVTRLQELERDAASLRDLSIEKLDLHRAALDPAHYHRARHVVTETARADRAAAALEAGDAALFGRLMNESHASLRDDFECCPPQIDNLAAIIRKCPNVYGARMTGGGFGGCVVALARASAKDSVESALRTEYDARYGVSSRLWCCRPYPGATLTPLAHA